MPLDITFRPGAEQQAPATALPKPYKYLMPMASVLAFVSEVKALVASLERKGNRELFQCVIVETKAIKYGVRFSVWLLTYSVGVCGEPEEGSTAEEWDVVCAALTALLQERLPGCLPYKEEFTEDHKPQYSFETYIRYTEHPLP